MTLPLPAAVIFDWDNTLVESWEAIGEAVNHTRAAFGLSTWSLPDVIQNCTRAARDSFPEWFGDRWEEAYEVYYQGFDDIRKRRPIKLMPGAGQLMDWLEQQRIPAFVVSNKRGDYLRYEVAKLGWEHRFKGVAGATDAPKDKPAREHVDFVLKDSGFNAGPALWFVGDSETDMLGARNSGCIPVLVGDAALAERLQIELAFKDCAGLAAYLAAQPN